MSQFKIGEDEIINVLAIYNELRKIFISEKQSYFLGEKLPRIRDIFNYYTKGTEAKKYSDQDSISIALTNAIKNKDTNLVNWYFESFDGLPESIEEVVKGLKVTFNDVIEYKKIDNANSQVVNKFFEIVSFTVFVTEQHLDNLQILVEYLKKGALDSLPFKKIINLTITNIELGYEEYLKVLDNLRNKMEYIPVRYFCRNIRYRVRILQGLSLLEAINIGFFNDFNSEQVHNSLHQLNRSQYISIRDKLLLNPSSSIISTILGYLSRKFFDLDYLFNNNSLTLTNNYN